MAKAHSLLMNRAKTRLHKLALKASLRILRLLLSWLKSVDMPMHDRTVITEVCAEWLAGDTACEAGEFLLTPATPAAFKILAKSAAAGGALKASSSQCGEDLIIHHIFANRGVTKPTYLDIGAHHPTTLSNTAIFYSAGCRGINVEPNPQLISEFRRMRPEDINLQLAVSDCSGNVDLLVPTNSTALATICRDNLPTGEHRVVNVPSVSLLELVNRYAEGLTPDLLSLDVEGHDLTILKQLTDLKMLPKVICVETVSYSPTGHGKRQDDIVHFLISIGYHVYADTSINTIFVFDSFWNHSAVGGFSR